MTGNTEVRVVIALLFAGVVSVSVFWLAYRLVSGAF